MDSPLAVLLSYFSALVHAQAQKLLAARVELSRLQAMTIPVEPEPGHCPRCGYGRSRIMILELTIAFLIRVLKRAGVRYTSSEKAFICSFVDRYSIAGKEIKILFGISRSSYYTWQKNLLGWGVSAFRDTSQMLVERVVWWVHVLKAANPSWGKVRIAQMMRHLGIAISPSSVWRYLRKKSPKRKRPSFKRPDPNSHKLQPRYANHYWAADVTTWSIFGFFRIRILAIMDLYSRKILVLKAFSRITRGDVRLTLLAAFARFGKPEHFITDRAPEFRRLHLGIDHRYGRVASPASTSRVERFWRSLKHEWLRYLFCPTVKSSQKYLSEYRKYFNRWRGHQALDGATPDQVYFRRSMKLRRDSVIPFPGRDVECLSFGDGVIRVFVRRAG